jgi:hypothetical protein
VTRSRVSPALAPLAILALVAACSSGPLPLVASSGPTIAPTEGSEPSGAPGPIDSGPPEPSEIAGQQVAGAWRRSPALLADSQIAIVSDACAASARESLGETEANLPTAVVDARGGGLTTAILSDGKLAIVCLARLDDTGATVDSIDRLSSVSFDAVDGSKLGLTEVARDQDLPGGVERTIAFGRVGPDAYQVKLGFDDASTLVAATGNGWWAAWWPGSPRASQVVAVDRSSIVVGSATAPKDVLENRVGRAAWWLDPTAEAPTADSRSIAAMALEEACASGKSGADRVDPPVVSVSDTGVTVTLWIRRVPGAQDCQGNEPFPYTIVLPEAVGDRTLFDGSETPPREAAKPPTG